MDEHQAACQLESRILCGTDVCHWPQCELWKQSHKSLHKTHAEVLGTSASDFFKEPSDEKVLYKKKEQTIYDEYDKGYILNWLVANSNEFDMEPLILTLRPNASYKNFKPSESDTFIYCLNGEVSLQLGNQVYKACKEDVLYFKAKDKHRLYNETDKEVKVLIVATASYL